MIENYNKVTCDSCGEEVLMPIGKLPQGWSCTDAYGDLCPTCLAKFRGFVRDFYGDETKYCKVFLNTLKNGLY